MADFVMKTFRVNDVVFVNKLVPNTKIEIGNKYSYNVGYSKNDVCRGEFAAEIFDKNDKNNFYIKVVLVGIFSFKDGAKKEKLHVDTFKALFPIVRSYIITLTSNAGIPPVIIPNADIDNQDIYRMDLNNRES